MPPTNLGTSGSRQATDWRSSVETERTRTAFASTTSGGSVSDGPQPGPRTSRSWTTTEEEDNEPSFDHGADPSRRGAAGGVPSPARRDAASPGRGYRRAASTDQRDRSRQARHHR